MCGIAGIFGHRNQHWESVLEAAAKTLAHRGPDDEGIEILTVNGKRDLSLGLVHRRLSIIDLSPAGHQPMRNPEADTWIVFNGEIYNYKEIRKILLQHGHTFRTNSDTEVILKAYSHWGEACVKQFRGMFAFAIWDACQSRIFLAVDRFGIKPLYYSKQGVHGFFFSSEVRTAITSGMIQPKIDPEAINSFLSYGSVQAPFTILKNLRTMLPGHYLIYDCKTSTTRVDQYWSPSDKTLVDTHAHSNCSGKDINELLRESVRLHLTSDVPLGIFLSGGIDSSILAMLISETSEAKALQSFSVSFTEDSFSEGQYARLIAKKLGCLHHDIIISEKQLRQALPAALSAMDQPSIDGINTYMISGVVKQAGIKAVLSGQGGDEVFGGYNTFDRIPRISPFLSWAHRLIPPTFLHWVADNFTRLSNESTFNVKVAQALKHGSDELSIYLIARQLLSPKARSHLLKHELGKGAENGFPHETSEWLRRETKGLNLFDTVSLLEMRCYLANTLLRDGDAMGMAHSVEIRVPYLDHKLVESVFSQNIKDKRSNRLPKPLLLRTVGNNLPAEIYKRPKMGFTFPWELWLRNQLQPEIEKSFNDVGSVEKLGLNINAVRQLWTNFLNHKTGVTWSRVWALYVLISWTRRHLPT